MNSDSRITTVLPEVKRVCAAWERRFPMARGDVFGTVCEAIVKGAERHPELDGEPWLHFCLATARRVSLVAVRDVYTAFGPRYYGPTYAVRVALDAAIEGPGRFDDHVNSGERFQHRDRLPPYPIHHILEKVSPRFDSVIEALEPTDDDCKIIDMLLDGKTRSEIGEALGIHRTTVQLRVDAMRERLLAKGYCQRRTSGVTIVCKRCGVDRPRVDYYVRRSGHILQPCKGCRGGKLS